MSKIKTLKANERLTRKEVKKYINKLGNSQKDNFLIHLATGTTTFKGDITHDFIYVNSCQGEY